MLQLTLTEFRTAPACPLSPVACDDIRRIVPSVRVEPTLGAPGHYDLTPGSWVGAIRTANLAIVIQPKIPMARLLFLLSYALDPSSWKDEAFELAVEASVVEAIIPVFVQHIRRAVKRGLLQDYRREDAALAVLRGRLDVQGHVNRRFGLLPPVDVSFDEFTEDHLLHRLLKAALLRLERMLVRSEHARRLLHRTLPLFANVESISFDGRRVPSVRYTRLNAHYRPAVELARLIIASTSFDNRHGAVESSSFLVDMNDIFESFVVTALRESLGLRPDVLAQGAALALDEDEQIVLRPDLTWMERGRPMFVGDVKYKALDATGYKHADLYQLLAYTVATELPGGLLVYAAGEGKPGSYRIPGVRKTLEVAWVDLQGSPAGALASIDRVATGIRKFRSAAASTAAQNVLPNAGRFGQNLNTPA